MCDAGEGNAVSYFNRDHGGPTRCCCLGWFLPRPGAEVCAKTVAKPQASRTAGTKTRKSIIPQPIDHRRRLNPKASSRAVVLSSIPTWRGGSELSVRFDQRYQERSS